MDRYLLVHLAEHMYNAGRYEELHELIDYDWMAVKRSKLGSHRSLTRDVELAIQAGQPTRGAELPRLLKHCLLSLTLNVLTTNVPPEILQVLAAAGQVEQALAHAELITDPFRQARAFQLIAAALLERGQAEVAEPLWARVRALLANVSRWDERAPILAAHARQMAQAGRPTDARQVIRKARGLVDHLLEAAKARNRYWRQAANVLTDIAAAQALLGEREAAAQSLAEAFTYLKRGHTSSYTFDWMEELREIVRVMAALGDGGGLKQVEKDLSRRSWKSVVTEDGKLEHEFSLFERRPLALAIIAWAFARTGRISLAQRELDQVRREDAFVFGRWDRHTADAMAEITLVKATIFWWNSRRRKHSGEGEAKERQLAKPFRWKRYDLTRWARSDRLDSRPGMVLGQLRDSRAREVRQALAETDRALARMVDQERLESKPTAKSRLKEGVGGAARLASKVRVPGALLMDAHLAEDAADERRWARNRRMDNLLTQAVALAKMAAALALIGAEEKARERFSEAVSAMEELEGQLRRDQALRQIALAMLRCGESAQADALAQTGERLPREMGKEDLYADLAVALARAGHTERASRAVADALLAARGLGNEDFAMGLAPRLAEAEHRAGLRLLVEEAEKDPDREDKGMAFAMLARSLARVGEGQLAKKLIRHAQGTLLSFDDLAVSPLTWCWIADAWAELGQQRQCQRVIRRCLTVFDVLAGRGMAGRLLYKALGEGQGGEDGVDGEEGDLGWMVLMLARPIVHVNDEESLARLLRGIHEIGNPLERIEALVCLAEQFAPAGLLPVPGDVEWEGADLFLPEPGRIAPTAAMRQMTQEALRGALSTAEGLDFEARAKALGSLGLAQAMLEDPAGLSSTMSAIASLPVGEHRTEALIEVAPALAWMGDRQGVDEVCAAVTSVPDRQPSAALPGSVLDALRILTIASVEAGDAAGAMELVERAVELAGQGVPSTEQVQVLAETATALLEARQWEPARRLLEATEQLAHALEDTEPGALAVVARLQALAGDERAACHLLTRGAVASRTTSASPLDTGVERSEMFNYLRQAVPALVALDLSGSVLASSWEKIREIDQWWQTQS